MADNTVDFPPIDCPLYRLLDPIPLDSYDMGRCKPTADIACANKICNISPKNKSYR